MRCRWCIENTFKYLEDHHGLHWLCDYQMEITPDTALARNPERTKALALLRGHEHTVAELQRQIGQHTTTPTPTDLHPAATLCMLQADLYTARANTRAAKAALKPIPAKLPANTIDPDAQRATPRVNRRALQTVCRLLAYNAELDLARALNTYLADPDEYRAITRHLLHQPGQIHYTPTHITVTIDNPHAPRIARALDLLIDQINTTPPKLGAPWMIGGDSRSRFRPEQGFWSSERRVEVACASAAGLWTARWAPCPAIVGTADACSSGQGWPRLRAGASG